MTAMKIGISIGIVFSSLAALFAFLLTYNEYQHHFLDRKRLIRIAAESAVIAFLTFMTIALFLGLILPFLIK